MKRYAIILSYDGSGLSGWQVQNNGPSVQGLLQDALGKALGENVKVTGAGRTDAEVNAINYVAHFDCTRPVLSDAERLVYKINAILPRNIVVHRIIGTGDDFHARFTAKYREYKYFVHRKKDPFAEKFSYWCRYGLDVGKMNMAASCLIGTYDFSCFEKTGGNNLTSVCTVSKALWETYTPVHVSTCGFAADSGDYLVFTIRADRFLRNMVRAVVGTLIDVGRGKRSPESVEDLILKGTRGDAGQSVPGNALFLAGVGY